VPSGVFNSQAICLIGTGMVVNPDELLKEIKILNKAGVSTDNIKISCKAHILMPYHVDID
jgi:adenylosuccinate synthase